MFPLLVYVFLQTTYQMEHLDFRDWIDVNIDGRNLSQGNEDWLATFMIVTWWIWKWRNDLVFKNENHELRQKMDWLLKQRIDVIEAFKKSQGQGKSYWNIQNLVWARPEPSRMVLNVDGSVNYEIIRLGVLAF